MSPDFPLHRTCLAEQIRDAVADRVARGVYPPGHRLVELALAREFGTSQAPVREALRMLEGLRLVEVVPHKGTRVRDLCARERRELCEVRAALEDMAGTLAAPHFRRDAAAAAELRRLDGTFKRTVKKGGVRAVAAADANFHRAIVRACGNESLVEFWEETALPPCMAAELARAELESPSDEAGHDAIILALVAGDGTLAGRRLRDHTLRAGRP